MSDPKKPTRTPINEGHTPLNKGHTPNPRPKVEGGYQGPTGSGTSKPPTGGSSVKPAGNSGGGGKK